MKLPPVVTVGLRDSRISLSVGIGFLLLLVIAEYVAIMTLNQGFFSYTLDDPYIHLALSENIMEGHYGVNSNEFSAPSSSILWPFLIAPLFAFSSFPLAVNIASAVATVYFFSRILAISLKGLERRTRDTLSCFLLVILVLATNLVGLVFNGMEHSLQVLLVTAITYGLIVEIRSDRFPPWLPAAIIIAPLVRYENLAVSSAAIGYLLLRRYFKISIISIMVLIILIGGFSLFLISLGLDPFPTSVAAKSPVVKSGWKIPFIIMNMLNNLHHRQGLILFFCAISFFPYMLFARNNRDRILALVSAAAISLHLLAGKFGSYNRCEIYIWTFFLLVFLHLTSRQIERIPGGRRQNIHLAVLITATAGLIGFFGNQYIHDLFTLPIAANNIFEQHYQMHRFAVDYYDRPVAVNDLGYVSYLNENYILDLWGLASLEAFNHRNNDGGAEWMQELADKNGVELAMIYTGWFESIPEGWILLGELHLGKVKVTPARSTVAFYATTPGACPGILEKLRSFVKTLPEDVVFTFKTDKGEGFL